MCRNFFNQLALAIFVWVIAQPLYAADLETETTDLAIADKSPTDWLREMVRAVKTTNYRGQFNYQQQTSAAFKVIYGLIDGKRFERLLYLGDRNREMIRHGDDVTFVVDLGDDFVHQLARHYPFESFGNGFTKMFANLSDYYEARKKSGMRKLAGRQTVIIDVMPKRRDRYSYKLWLDSETALLLRFEQLDMKQRSLELFSFEQIDINAPIQPEDTLVNAGPGQVRIQLKIDDAVTKPVIDTTTNWHVAWAPEGFAVSSYNVERPFPGSDNTLLNVAYSDSLSAFSVYIEKPEPGFRISPRTQISGSITTVVRQVQDNLKRLYTIIVVGDIPANLAERIAQSVTYGGSVSAKQTLLAK